MEFRPTDAPAHGRLRHGVVGNPGTAERRLRLHTDNASLQWLQQQRTSVITRRYGSTCSPNNSTASCISRATRIQPTSYSQALLRRPGSSSQHRLLGPRLRARTLHRLPCGPVAAVVRVDQNPDSPMLPARRSRQRWRRSAPDVWAARRRGTGAALRNGRRPLAPLLRPVERAPLLSGGARRPLVHSRRLRAPPPGADLGSSTPLYLAGTLVVTRRWRWPAAAYGGRACRQMFSCFGRAATHLATRGNRWTGLRTASSARTPLLPSNTPPVVPCRVHRSAAGCRRCHSAPADPAGRFRHRSCTAGGPGRGARGPSSGPRWPAAALLRLVAGRWLAPWHRGPPMPACAFSHVVAYTQRCPLPQPLISLVPPWSVGPDPDFQIGLWLVTAWAG